jgi:hypothetical protein
MLHSRPFPERFTSWARLLELSELPLQRFVLGDGHGPSSSRGGLGALGSKWTCATHFRIELDRVARFKVLDLSSWTGNRLGAQVDLEVELAEQVGVANSLSPADGPEEGEPEAPVARRPVFPSSIGFTVLVHAETKVLKARVTYGTYTPKTITPGGDTIDGRRASSRPASPEGVRPAESGSRLVWVREPHAHEVTITLDEGARIELRLPEGVLLRAVLRDVPETELPLVKPGTRYLTLFLVNQRRTRVDVFPPPGPNRRTSFFAETVPTKQAKNAANARLYVGIVAPGRSQKVLLMRTYIALLAAAKRAFDQDPVAADPYMTLVGYFNSLRELGGSRRIVEDEVRARLMRVASRRRFGEATSSYVNRTIDFECVELTSRESTDKVKIAKERLAQDFGTKSKNRAPVDVALASNMISVGLDITRLGLMVVCGQPKTTAEYIQATSRVGRDDKRPGLVVALLNVHKPRARSHFEHFKAYHESFYRNVEATSVTPFAPRAIDRGLSGVAVALARLGDPRLTAPDDAAAIASVQKDLDFIGDVPRASSGTGRRSSAASRRGQRCSARGSQAGKRSARIGRSRSPTSRPLASCSSTRSRTC